MFTLNVSLNCKPTLIRERSFSPGKSIHIFFKIRPYLFGKTYGRKSGNKRTNILKSLTETLQQEYTASSTPIIYL